MRNVQSTAHHAHRVLRSLLLFVPVIFLFSCNKNQELFSNEDKETSNNESAQECTTNELDDIATSILNNSTISGSAGGHLNLIDDRFSCDGTTVVFADVNTEKTSGKVTITFPPDGCTDKKGNIRKGSIEIVWSGGRWFKPGSYHIITLTDYSINDVAIIGTQRVTCIAFRDAPLSVTWTIVAEHKAVWPDGTFATRKVYKLRKWDHTPTEDTFTVSNGPSSITSAEGINRHGKNYKVYITNPLIYLGSCAKSSKVFIPVQGEKVITHISSTGKTKSLTVNFGTGVCDNSYTVIAGTMVKVLTAKNDSSGD